MIAPRATQPHTHCAEGQSKGREHRGSSFASRHSSAPIPDIKDHPYILI